MRNITVSNGVDCGHDCCGCKSLLHYVVLILHECIRHRTTVLVIVVADSRGRIDFSGIEYESTTLASYDCARSQRMDAYNMLVEGTPTQFSWPSTVENLNLNDRTTDSLPTRTRPTSWKRPARSRHSHNSNPPCRGGRLHQRRRGRRGGIFEAVGHESI